MQHRYFRSGKSRSQGSNFRSTRFLGLAALAIAPVLTKSASAASKYWDTDGSTAGLQSGGGAWDTGTSSLWSTASGGTALTTWSTGDDAFFQTGGNNIVTLSGGISANSISFLTGGTATNTTLIGGSLTLTGPAGITGNTTSDASTLTLNTDVSIGQNQSWTTPASSVLTFNGNISSSAANVVVTFQNGGSGGQRQIYLNGTNFLGGIATTGSSSTARTLYIDGATSLSGTLKSSGSQTVNGQIYAGADLVVNQLNPDTSTLGVGGNNTVNGNILLSGGGTLILERDANIGGGSQQISVTSGELRILGTAMTNLGAHTLGMASGANLRMDIDDASNSFTLDKVVAGGTTTTLTKYGKGTLVLTQANTYGSSGTSGGTVIRGGTFNVDNNQGGSISNTALLTMNGGTFLLTGKNGGTTTQGAGAVTQQTWGSTIKADGGTSTGTTLNLGAITAATNGGTLNIATIGNTTPIITTTSTVDGTGILNARVTFNGTNWAAGGSGGAITAYSGYADLVTGADSLNSQLTAASATLASSRQVNTLRLASATAGTLDLGSGNTLTISAGGLLNASGGAFTVSNGTLKSGTATNSDLIVHQAGSNTLEIASVIANGNGTSVLTKTGDGTLVLSGANTFTGATWINGGAISVSVVSGTNNNLGAASNQALNINGGTLIYTGASASKNSAINIGTMGAAIDVVNAATTLTLSGSIGDETAATDARTGTLTKKGAGILSLTGSGLSAPSFTGGVFIEAGVLQVVSASLNTTTPNAVTFTAGSTGTLRTNGANVTVSALKTDPNTPGTTFVENNSASTASTLTVNSTFASTYGGTIRNGGSATLSLVKTGGNTLKLTGSNTYSGTTTILAGALIVNGTLTASNLSVGSSGTLGGIGEAQGAVTTGGTRSVITPGDAGVGKITLGSLDVSAGARFRLELGSSTANSDRIEITSGLSSTIADDGRIILDLQTSNASAVAANTPYTLMTFGSQTSLTENDLTVLTPGWTLDNTFDSNGIRINSGSLEVQFSVVPEPGTLSLLGLALPALLRRRQRKSTSR